jgi:trehalose 6-phosphate phosphatase
VVRELARPGTLVVLDFDGTLAPIVADRRRATLSARSRVLLTRLARLYPVAVLSGRAAQDVAERLGGAEVRWVVGSHGAEWLGERRDQPAWRGLVGSWRATLAGRLQGLPGVELEVKPHSLAVHYRHSADRRAASARIRRAVEDLPGVTLVPGKAVVNLVPEGAGDKGTALRRLVEVASAERVLFVGDDVTDEAAFGAALDVPAVTVRVGRDRATRASYWLTRRTDVDTLLERLCALREASLDLPPGPAAPSPARRQPVALGSVLGFMKDLWALEQGLHQRSKAMLARHGVTGPQRLVIRVVGRLGPISPAQLARELHLHPSSVTRLLRRLEARRLVHRTPQPTHRGRMLVQLGPRGGEVERLAAGTVETTVRSALEVADARDVAATRRVIALVTERLVGRDPRKHSGGSAPA